MRVHFTLQNLLQRSTIAVAPGQDQEALNTSEFKHFGILSEDPTILDHRYFSSEIEIEGHERDGIDGLVVTLMMDRDTDNNNQIISIYGMGGLGKIASAFQCGGKWLTTANARVSFTGRRSGGR